MKTASSTSFVSALVITIFLVGIWAALVVMTHALKAEIAVLSASSDTATARAAHAASLSAFFKGIDADIATIDSRFIVKEGIPEFINMVDMKAEEMGVKADITSINLEEVNSADPTALRALRVHVVGSGSWTNAMTFIAFLETIPYASRAEQVTLSKTAGVWNFVADITAYVAPDILIQ